jgi:hypothetical protein
VKSEDSFHPARTSASFSALIIIKSTKYITEKKKIGRQNGYSEHKDGKPINKHSFLDIIQQVKEI